MTNNKTNMKLHYFKAALFAHNHYMDRLKHYVQQGVLTNDQYTKIKNNEDEIMKRYYEGNIV